MKKNVIRCIAFAVMMLALSLCFVGCDLSFGNNSSGGGNSGTGAKTVIGIGLVGNIKTEYVLNEELDLNGAKLQLMYEDDTSKEIDLLQSMITNFSTQEIGEFTLTITYKGKTITKNYTVSLSVNAISGYYTATSTDIAKRCHKGTDIMIDENSQFSLLEVFSYTNITIRNDNTLVWIVKNISDNYEGRVDASYEIVDNKAVCTITMFDNSTENVPSTSEYSMTISFSENKLSIRTNNLFPDNMGNEVDYIMTYTKTN